MFDVSPVISNPSCATQKAAETLSVFGGANRRQRGLFDARGEGAWKPFVPYAGTRSANTKPSRSTTLRTRSGWRENTGASFTNV